ncbi:hypothetical protein SEA_POPPER_68 [Arthrobacter phage Popper]|uniref:Uncharacterized protein n=1 Tax=Arthrobacter phage Popper TaxID=2859633 RepID=A0AAE8BEI0_9CAUD|nr:hypothetical protein QEO78_gp38 [Arthrobacter phage Popper]QYC54985.1 hypothetical protein SEA_POPPER_68 [Arthrobacter phage Popper]
MSDQETGWPAQRMGMPIGWYAEVAAGSGAEFPVSGDATAVRVSMRRAVLVTRGDGSAPWYWSNARIELEME